MIQFISKTEDEKIKKLIPFVKVDPNGSCTFSVRNEEGISWGLLYINTNGEAYLIDSINTSIGLKITENGKLDIS